MKSKFILLVLCVGMIPVGALPTRIVRAQEAPRQIDVTAKRFFFTPDEIIVKKGQPVVLVIKSLDVTHGLRFRDLNLDVQIPKGTSVELKFTPDQTGDFVGHCAVFCGAGHGGMMLTLHVVD